MSSATYHTPHPFKTGVMLPVWNPKTRKSELRENPYFCVVCGRKQDNILHLPTADSNKRG